MKKIYVLGILLLMVICLSGNPVKRAERKMRMFEYSKATQILSKSVKKSKYKEASMPMLAECYRMQRQFRKAKTWYERSISQPNVDAKTYYYYALALRSTGDYALAKEYFMKYNELTKDQQALRAASSCDSVLGRWQSIKPRYEIKEIPALNTESSEFGSCYYDGKLYFTSDRSKALMESSKYGWTGRGYLKIMQSMPKKGTDFYTELESPKNVKEGLNKEYHNGPVAFWRDEIYITRSYKSNKAKKKDNIKTNQLRIFTAKKNPNGSWDKQEPFFLNNPDYSIGHPTPSPDGQILYFVSDMPGGYGGQDIWMCKRSGDSWGSPENLGTRINTVNDEMFPTISGDTGLYFASDGQPGYGGLDIFYIKKDKDGKWQIPTNLYLPVNSSEDDFSIGEVPNSDIGFFSSDRNGGKGSDDIYAFKKLPAPPEAVKPPKPMLTYITGLVKDKKTFLPLGGSTVFLLNKKTGDIEVLKTDPSGRYISTAIDTTTDYLVKAMQTDYIADCRGYQLEPLRVKGDTLCKISDLLLDRLEVGKTFKIDNIYYDYDKWAIREDAKIELDKLVRIMKENVISIELGSHTDCRGSNKYNETLSQKRAESAVAYIATQGIPMERITAKGYGETVLVNHCKDGVQCTPEEHQANRRTEFKVIAYEEKKPTHEVFDHHLFKQGDKRKEADFPVNFFKDCK